MPTDTHLGKPVLKTAGGKLDLEAYDVNELNFHAMKLSSRDFLTEAQFHRIMIDIKKSNIGHKDISDREIRRLKDVFTSNITSLAVLHEAGLISDAEREALLPEIEDYDEALDSAYSMLAD